MKKKLIVTGLVVMTMAMAAGKQAMTCEEGKSLKTMTKQVRQLLNEGNSSEAVILAEETVSKFGDSPISHYYAAKAFDADGNSEKAIEEYEKCLELHEDNFNALNNLGLLYIMSGKLDSAREVLEKAVEMEGAEDYAFNNLGVTYERLGMIADAATMFEKAIAINPEYEKAKESLARVSPEKNTELCRATTKELISE